MSQYKNEIFNHSHNKDLVSIIVPVYNADHYLKECIESLLKQTYPFIEIILVIEESDISCKTILSDYKSNKKLKIIEEKRNLGPAHTRNLAIRNAKGKYISFCDVDDFFSYEKIEIQIKMMKNEIGLVYSDFYLINENSEIIDEIYTPEWDFDSWIRSGYIAFSTVIVKKNLLDEIQLIDENLSSNEDFDLLIKLSKITEFKRASGFLAYRRIHKSNLSKNTKTLITRYHIYKKYNYNLLAIKSIIVGFIYSRIFYNFLNHKKLYAIAKYFKR